MPLKRRLTTRRPQGKPLGRIDAEGYRLIEIDGVEYHAEDLAWVYMTGSWPARPVLHRDGNHGNNAWSNLALSPESDKQPEGAP